MPLAAVRSDDVSAGVGEFPRGLFGCCSHHGEEAARSLVEGHRRDHGESGVVPGGLDGELGLLEGEHGLDDHGIGATLFKGGDLVGEGVEHLGLAHGAQGLDELACGPYGSCDEAAGRGLTAGVLG